METHQKLLSQETGLNKNKSTLHKDFHSLILEPVT